MTEQNLYNEDGTGIREFRVRKISRYEVTDWAQFNGGSSVVLAENLTRDQANKIAEAFGAAHPGALVNTIGPPHAGSVDYLPPIAGDSCPSD